MRLILDIDSFDGFQKRVWMTNSEMMQIGRSSQADVCVEGDSALSDFHFSIQGSLEGWSLNAARGARVGVNGVAVQQHRLSHGDTIIAGQTEFRISIEAPSGPSTQRTAVAAPAATTEPKTPATFTQSNCSSGIVQLTVKLNDTPLATVLEKLAGSGSLYIAFNEQRFGGPLQGAAKLTEDLFAQAPEEIRLTDSLVIAECKLDEQNLSHLTSAAQADAAALFVSSAPLDQILSEQRIGWAWYARPSILKQQITVGSKELAKKLLAVIDMAVMFAQEDSNVIALVRADVAEAVTNRLANL